MDHPMAEMATDHEVELKFELATEDADRFDAAAFGAAGRPKRQNLVSVYHDTEDGRLRDQGIALRVRRIGKRRIQALKHAERSGAGLFDRDEWEVAIAADAPDLDLLPEPARALLSEREIKAADLRPVFETQVKRRAWLMESDEAVIEIVCDIGRVMAGQAETSLCELELELKSGPPEALFALARRIQAEMGLRIGVRSKSERGYALGAEARPAKAEPIPLDPDMSTADGFKAVMRGCLRHIRLNEDLLAQTRAPEALHQMRVGMRRLRSALTLFRNVVEGPEYERLKGELRRLSQDFGRARDLDVHLEKVLRPQAEAGKSPGAAKRLAEAERQREAAYDSILATLDGRAFQKLMLDLLAWTESGEWLANQDPHAVSRRDEPVEDFAAEALERFRGRLIKKGRGLKRLSPDERHRVRIVAKKLRYASEFFADAFPGKKPKRRRKRFLSALEDLQTALGDLNDMEMAARLAASVAPAPVAEAGDASRQDVPDRGAADESGHAEATNAAPGTEPADGASADAAETPSSSQDNEAVALLKSARKSLKKLKRAPIFWS